MPPRSAISKASVRSAVASLSLPRRGDRRRARAGRAGVWSACHPPRASRRRRRRAAGAPRMLISAPLSAMRRQMRGAASRKFFERVSRATNLPAGATQRNACIAPIPRRTAPGQASGRTTGSPAANRAAAGRVGSPAAWPRPRRSAGPPRPTPRPAAARRRGWCACPCAGTHRRSCRRSRPTGRRWRRRRPRPWRHRPRAGRASPATRRGWRRLAACPLPIRLRDVLVRPQPASAPPPR